MLKAVIFDMDGVIIDSEPIYKRTERELFRELGIPVSEKLHKAYVGVKSSRMWADLKEMFCLKQEVEELTLSEKTRYVEKLLKLKDIRAIDGIAELLALLRNANIKTAIASSSDIEVIGLVTNMFGIDGFFTVKVSGEQVQNGKPDPDIFLHTAELIGNEPKECIVVEDSTNGLTAAKRAGMKSIGFRNPNSGNQDLTNADVVVDSIKEIDMELLKKLLP